MIMSKTKHNISTAWNRYHLTIFITSLLLSVFLVLFVIFKSKPSTDMSLTGQVLLYASIYIAFVVFVAGLYYMLIYFPNYIFYKKMIQDGKEWEIQEMLNEHGFNKLINSSWFILKDRSSLVRKSKRQSDKSI